MATTLPPWLQISPEQFTQSAIAGGQQGYQAAAAAGQLAQAGLLKAAELASQAASRAAEIQVRREQINASLAENAARVAAAQQEAAAQNAIRQQQVELARVAEQNNVAQEAARLAAAQELKAMDVQGEKDVAGIRANAPQNFAPSDLGRMVAEMNALPEGDPLRQVYQQRLDKLAAVTTKKTELPVAEKAELSAARKELQDIFAKYQSGEVATSDQATLQKRTALQKRIQELEGRMTSPVAAPGKPAGPLRYQLIDGQYQLTQ